MKGQKLFKIFQLFSNIFYLPFTISFWLLCRRAATLSNVNIGFTLGLYWMDEAVK